MTIADTAQEKPKPTRRKLTFEEFLDWCDEDTLAEFVDGEVVMYSPASITHQRIDDFLGFILRAYIENKGLGEIVSAPFAMYMPKLNRSREPDLIFVSKERLNLLKETYLNGPADLAVEIVSPESEERDKCKKFGEYEKSGVKEYWLIDPRFEEALFYQLKDERYHSVKPDKSGIYHSKVIEGFWLKVNWLFRIPPVFEVLKELDLLP